MKDSLFPPETLKLIQKARKIFLLTATWILIAELAAAVIAIMTGSSDQIISNIKATFWVFAIVLFVSVNNFRLVEKENKTIQAIAMAGFAFNILWAVVELPVIWELAKYYEKGTGFFIQDLAAYGVLVSVILYSAAACFFVANFLSIKENSKAVKPLKLTAVVSTIYLWIWAIITTCADISYDDAEKFYQLSGLAGLAFVITSIAAATISRSGEKRAAKTSAENNVTPSTPKTDAELRAEIEEKVRREMIEKEVRAKVESEMTNKNND